MSQDIQVKNKKRVTDHGEVFTAKREVEAMLDLVKQETERIESRFLEPACGDGNFLAEILKRKLVVVESRYKKSQLEFERNAITAISSVYGIDILEDNVFACRARLLSIFTDFYTRNYKDKGNPKCVESAEYVLSKNIIWGDALDLTIKNDGRELIIFSEWSAMNGSMIKRRDFIFNVLVNESYQPSMFSDEGNPVNIPEHRKEFPVTHFLEISKYD